jgi:energy-converting hydrogenase A subunit M
MMQEAAFTEVINKKSLAELLKIENDNIKDILGKRERFAPGEQIIKFK